MKRTVSLKLLLSPEQTERLARLQAVFADACNQAVPLAAQAKIANRIKLHHAAYYSIRQASPALGAQMACNAVHQVAKAYKTLLANNQTLRNGDWAQLQEFVAYKALAAGIRIERVNPAYTSKTCAVCGNLGIRSKHRFSCPFCGRLAHADRNAALNIASLGSVSTVPTGAVNRPHVATLTG